MSYAPYKMDVLIPDSSEVDFATVIEAIRAKFSRLIAPPQIEQMRNTCLLRYEDWTFTLNWQDDPDILEESAEYIAACAQAQGIDVSVIATCSRRITTGGDPDPNMMYFNDYIYVLEVLESFEGIYLFDPDVGKFLESGEKHS